MNFRIVEGDYSLDEKIWDELIDKLENEPDKTLRSIARKFGVSANNVQFKWHKLLKERGLESRKYRKPKYYYFNSIEGKYKVCKHINGRTVYYATCKNEKEAKEVVDLLKSIGWDKQEFEKLRSR